MGEPVPMNLPAIRQILAMQLALRNGEPGAVQGKPVALDRINHKGKCHEILKRVLYGHAFQRSLLLLLR